MSKNIPKPIIRIGHSTKKNGTITTEIDGNKVKNMSEDQFNKLRNELHSAMRKLANVRIKHSSIQDGVLTERQYEEIESLIRDGAFLMAVKFYKELSGVGLYEAKQFVDNLKEFIK